MTAGPIRPLTPQQQAIAELVGYGYDAEQIADRLKITVSTVRLAVKHIAYLFPNPDNLRPWRLVLLWAAHQRWVREYVPKDRTA